MKKTVRNRIFAVFLSALMAVVFCTACQESTSVAKSKMIQPPVAGLEWGMTMETALEKMGKTDPEVNANTDTAGETSYIVKLTAEETKALQLPGLGGLPVDERVLSPLGLEFRGSEAATAKLVAVTVRVDLTKGGTVTSEDGARQFETDELNKLYGQPLRGTTRGTTGFKLETKDCGGLNEAQMATLRSGGYDASFVYPTVETSLSEYAEGKGNLRFSGWAYVNYNSGK